VVPHIAADVAQLRFSRFLRNLPAPADMLHEVTGIKGQRFPPWSASPYPSWNYVSPKCFG
jgi:hypothetical protein